MYDAGNYGGKAQTTVANSPASPSANLITTGIDKTKAFLESPSPASGYEWWMLLLVAGVVVVIALLALNA